MAMPMATTKFSFFLVLPPSSPSSSSSSAMRMLCWKPPNCAPLQEIPEQIDVGVMCEPCNGKGWLLCDFCEGKKTNVKAKNNRIYRRCPSCRAPVLQNALLESDSMKRIWKEQQKKIGAIGNMKEDDHDNDQRMTEQKREPEM